MRRGYFHSLVGIWLIVAVVATACTGGSTAADSADTAPAAGTAPAADAGFGGPTMPLELVSLGAMAQSRGAPTVASFDGDGGSVVIDGEATLIAPEGAFATQTNVTVEVFDLDLSQYLSDAPQGSLYVVSTVDDVALATPVMLEVALPPDGQTVTKFSDGDWRPVDTAADRIVVPIEHFSTVTISIMGLVDERARALSEATPDASDATFLRACIYAVTGMLGGLNTEADDSDIEFAVNLAMSICTNALIDRATPGGRSVSTACVGDKIGITTNFRQAVDECLADQDEAAAPPEDETNEAAAEPTAAPPAEPTGPMTFTGASSTGAVENENNDQLISVDFIANVDASTASIDATFIINYWLRGGFEEDERWADQNCGVTYEHVVHFEGPAGNPAHLLGVVDASRVVEVFGVLCDEDDHERWLLDVGESTGSFRGKANGLGVDGEFRIGLRQIQTTNS